jgi:hypothetical protein
VAAAFLFITVSIRRAKRRSELIQGIAFERDSVPVSLLELLTALPWKIGRMLRRLFLLIRTMRFASCLRPKTKGEILSTPRALYRALLQWTTKRGIARSEWQTPLEYLKIISRRFPEMERELALITEVYIQARYGRLPPRREEFEEAIMAWWRVRAAE